MFGRKKNTDLILDDYIDDNYDENYGENFYSENNLKRLSKEEEEYNNFFKVTESDDDYDANYMTNVDDESNYEDFVKVHEVDKGLDEDKSLEQDSSSYYTYDDINIYKFLSIFILVFKWIGVAIAIVLISYFIIHGNIKSLLIYILGLIFAFFFGYFFMFIFNKFTGD